MKKEGLFIRFLKWIGLIVSKPVDKKEMCKHAMSVCDHKCSECIWGQE